MSKSVRRAILVSLLTLVVYPLSYAPIDRTLYGDDSTSAWFCARRLPVFMPVLLLIDHTPFDRPLLWWSSIWGVDARHIADRSFRHEKVYGLGGNPFTGPPDTFGFKAAAFD